MNEENINKNEKFTNNLKGSKINSVFGWQWKTNQNENNEILFSKKQDAGKDRIEISLLNKSWKCNISLLKICENNNIRWHKYFELLIVLLNFASWTKRLQI